MINPKINPEVLGFLIQGELENLGGLVCTDKELLRLVNRKLPPDLRICSRTFRRYKKAGMAEQEEFDPEYGGLYDALLDNNIAQKKTLMRHILETQNNQWVKSRWILERKFPEFNLRYQTAKFLKELAEEDEDDLAEEKPIKAKRVQEKKEPEPEKSFRLGMVDMDGNDWSDYMNQKYRKIHADCKGEPFTEEWLPQPAPLTKTYLQQQKEKQEAEERMANGKSQMANEGMANGKSQMANEGMADERMANGKSQMANEGMADDGMADDKLQMANEGMADERMANGKSQMANDGMAVDKLQMANEGMANGKSQMANERMANDKLQMENEGRNDHQLQGRNETNQLQEDDFDISKIKGDPEWRTTDEEERAYVIGRRAWLKVQGLPYTPGARPYNDDEDDDDSESLNIPRNQVQVYDMDELMRQAMEQREQQQKDTPPAPEEPKKIIYPPGTKKIWGIK